MSVDGICLKYNKNDVLSTKTRDWLWTISKLLKEVHKTQIIGDKI
jgi:hypothetical protein